VEAAVESAAETLLLIAQRLRADLATVISAGGSSGVEGLDGMSGEDALGAIANAAMAIVALAEETLGGSLKPYVSRTAVQALSDAGETARSIWESASAAGGRVSSGFSRAAEDFSGLYLASVSDTIHEAERMMVLEEHAYIGVYELNEVSPGAITIAGAAAVVILIIALASGG
jgi:hypothetical protein